MAANQWLCMFVMSVLGTKLARRLKISRSSFLLPYVYITMKANVGAKPCVYAVSHFTAASEKWFRMQLERQTCMEIHPPRVGNNLETLWPDQ